MLIAGVLLGLVAMAMMLVPGWFFDGYLFGIEGLRTSKAGWIVALIALMLIRRGRK